MGMQPHPPTLLFLCITVFPTIFLFLVLFYDGPWLSNKGSLIHRLFGGTAQLANSLELYSYQISDQDASVHTTKQYIAGIFTICQSSSVELTPKNSKKLANPSLSHRSSHQSMVTIFPNHYNRKQLKKNSISYFTQ